MSCSPGSSIAPATGAPTASVRCSSLTGRTVNVYVPTPTSNRAPSTSSTYVPVVPSTTGPTSELVPLKSRKNTTLLNRSTSRHTPLPAPLRACASKPTWSPATALSWYTSVSRSTSPLTGVPGVIPTPCARSSSRKLYAPTTSPSPSTVSVYVPATSPSTGLPMSFASEPASPRPLTTVPAGPTSVHTRFPLFVKLSKYSRAALPSVKL